jgi:DMSO/TMAO reductase YedYZ molybdopterin-dependent catalytic subunit
MEGPMSHPLPPGQVEVAGFPRFGAHLRKPPPPLPEEPAVRLGGPLVREQAVLGPADLARLPRHEVSADFHCVAGWSATALRWGGFRFAEAYDTLLAPHLAGPAPVYITARGLDGWRATIFLEDLLADDVLLADELDGRPLAPEHGAPLRLVSPAQYGFMSVKHLCRLEVHETDPGWPRRMRLVSPHPRARVAREERRADLPGLISRAVYRPLLGTFLRMAGAGEDGRPVRTGRVRANDSGR